MWLLGFAYSTLTGALTLLKAWRGRLCAQTMPRLVIDLTSTEAGHLLSLQDIFSFGCILWELLTFERPWGSIINPWQAG